ncbi:hypothetical protein ACFFTN_09795 [Aminobacter aganoensis]|uniref:Uncharacterized protein n=1 Tax=Aminobacter aganoensis TaxID=83264 RepID=A0A7X0FAX2_9HYPH|nr:hypothetical protein [Aminobacter aganoensis]MBB6356320.1 hypothetical protein [Aminobacter aganoensis]
MKDFDFDEVEEGSPTARPQMLSPKDRRLKRARKVMVGPRARRPRGAVAAVPYDLPEAFDESLQRSAMDLVRPMLHGHEDMHSDGLVPALVDNVAKLARLSHRAHLKAIASAYAFFILDNYLGHKLSIALEERFKVTRVVRKNYDPIRFYLERIISYDGKAGRADKGRADALYARDARAIRHLISISVGPAELVEKAKEKGHGLDAWSRSPKTASVKSRGRPAVSSVAHSIATVGEYSVALTAGGKPVKLTAEQLDVLQGTLVMFLEMVDLLSPAERRDAGFSPRSQSF